MRGLQVVFVVSFGGDTTITNKFPVTIVFDVSVGATKYNKQVFCFCAGSELFFVVSVGGANNKFPVPVQVGKLFSSFM